MKARDMRRGDRLSMNTSLRVLSVENVAPGLVKVTAEAENSTSIEYTDDGHLLEFLCKSYRPFSSTYLPDNDDGGRDDDGDDDDDVDPPRPTKLEPVTTN